MRVRLGVAAMLGAQALALGLLGCSTPPEAAPTDDGLTEGGTDESTGSEPVPSGPPLPPRPDSQHCRFEGWAPGLLPPLVFDAEPEVPPVAGARVLVRGPDGNPWIGTDDGRVLAVDLDGASPTWTERLAASGEPITGLAASTDTDGDHLFIRSEAQGPPRTRVWRLTLDAEGALDPASAVEVIEQAHDEGDRSGRGLSLHDGRLWIPLGDGESGDTWGPAADPDLRPGSLLRLGIDALSSTGAYEIPPDNPLADEPGPAAEAWAWGLRDPGPCVHDEGDRLWCVDAGEVISEASLVDAADDLGWPRFEGTDCLLFGGCENVDSRLPQGTYRHGPDDCGVVAAAPGDDLDAELVGALVYADACSGRVFAVRPADESRPAARAIVAQLPRALVGLLPEPGQGVLALDADGQLGWVVARRPEGEFPLSLSDSGCFPAPDQPAPDLVPYELNAPLWTDGSLKQRHLVLPPGATLGVEDDGRLRFPEGALVLKTFSYALDPFTPEVITPVETRVMIRRGHGWEFHSYAWDEDGHDAQLLSGARERSMLAAVEGTPTVITHQFPSREECGYCHGAGEAGVLGPRLDQLAREVDYDGQLAPQLEALASIELFEGPLPAITPMTSYFDEEASDEARARAYLHANCGHCHRPGGWVPPPLTMDLRWSTATAETQLCGVPPQYASTFSATLRVDPGEPSNSLVWQRISTRGLWQMPPLATSTHDPHAMVVRAWIESLDGCEG